MTLADIPELAALLHAIRTTPFDDTPRLAYADRLQEWADDALTARDDALREYARDAALQAEYIRSAILHPDPYQVLNAVPPTTLNQGEPANVVWRYEPGVTEITGWNAHDSRELRREAWRWYARGFVYRIGLPVLEFLEHAKRLFECHPIVEVELYDRQASHYYADEQIRRPLIFQWDVCEESDIARDSPLPGFIPRVLWEGDEISMDMASRESWDGGRYRAGGARSVGRSRRFATRGLAHLALSRRCVNYGRELAGLPAVEEWPTEGEKGVAHVA